MANLGARRAIIATGGSVVYGAPSREAAARPGPAGLPARPTAAWCWTACSSNMQARPGAIAPGQTIEDLFEERRLLYEEAADLVVDTDHLAPDQCVDRILAWLRGEA